MEPWDYDETTGAVWYLKTVDWRDLARWYLRNYGPSFWCCDCDVCRYAPGNPRMN